MKLIFSILLISWTFSSLSAKIHSPLVFDQTAHIQSVLNQNSKSELPEHYQSFSEIDLKEEKSRFILLMFGSVVPELNDFISFLNFIFSSFHSYAFYLTYVFTPHLPLYISVRHILI